MEKYELQKLRDLPIEGVAERLGLRVVRHKCLCPFHDDHHASMSFRVSKNTFRCFVCGASGGTIDLVMRYLNKDFKAACQWLAGIDHSHVPRQRRAWRAVVPATAGGAAHARAPPAAARLQGLQRVLSETVLSTTPGPSFLRRGADFASSKRLV